MKNMRDVLMYFDDSDPLRHKDMALRLRLRPVLPVIGSRNQVVAVCHPNRPHKARGLCSACYMRDWKQRREAS